MAQDLLTCPQVAVDTESNGLYAYQEQVCLIQFSTGETDYLVDPLALYDLSPLGPFLPTRVSRKFSMPPNTMCCA